MPLGLLVLTAFSSDITTEAEIHNPTEPVPVTQPVRVRVLDLATFLQYTVNQNLSYTKIICFPRASWRVKRHCEF